MAIPANFQISISFLHSPWVNGEVGEEFMHFFHMLLTDFDKGNSKIHIRLSSLDGECKNCNSFQMKGKLFVFFR